MNVIGIDPGLTGAVAQWDGSELIVLPIPTIFMGKKRFVDWGKLYNTLWFSWPANIEEVDEVFLEQVSTRPGEGRVSAFNFGQTFGGLKVLVVCMIDRPATLVTPRTWKKYFGLSADKREAVELAAKLWPDHKDKFYGPRGGLKDGTAEAALISRYGYETVKETPPCWDSARGDEK